MERLGRWWPARVLVAGLCAWLVVAAGCRQQEPLRIGFFAALSGRGADLGIGGRNGAMLAIEERNAAGGVKGRRVDLLVRDATQDPETARQRLSELLQQPVVAVIGPMVSSLAVVAAPLADAAQIPLLSPTATTAALTGLDDYFFRVISDTNVYATRNAHYLAQKLRYRRAVVIYDLANQAYTQSWLGHFRAEFGNWGGEMVAEAAFTSGGDVAFNPLVAGLLATHPDFILIIANSIDAAQICQQIRKMSQTLPIAMSEWGATERFIELAGRAADQVYVAQFLDRNDTSPRYQQFRQAYLQRFGQEPGFAGVAGYDAALVLLAALERQGSGEALKSVLLKLGEVEGVQQRLRFDRFGDSNRDTYLFVIRDGHYQALE